MTYLLLEENITRRFTSNSEAFASELLENLQAMSPRDYMYCDMLIMCDELD